MGALHDGHLSLVRLAKTRCDVVVASIFVNPKQFAPHEDLDRYPRDEEGDLAKLAHAGCDLVFGPQPNEMYPDHFSTSVHVSGVSAPLEGESRPHFFGGVATVVT
jgi:pantoate--beta-alanine ligase